MHVLLIYLSVIMISSLVESSKEEDIQDLSEWCSHRRVLYYYLTSGIGVSDKSVGMIAKEKSINCTVKYSVKAKQYIMLVLEFPDLTPRESVCITEKNTSVMVSDLKSSQNCYLNGSEFIFSKMSQDEVSVNFRSEKEISTIKITATSMRGTLGSKCSSENEIECRVRDKMYCMTHTVACDGHNNCGVADSFDEDKKKCKERQLTFLMILFTLIMGIMSLLLFTSLWVAFLPKRKEVFVYKFDQGMPLFDSENDIDNAEIEITVIFPKEKKP